jgi:hypothetical protein
MLEALPSKLSSFFRSPAPSSHSDWNLHHGLCGLGARRGRAGTLAGTVGEGLDWALTRWRSRNGACSLAGEPGGGRGGTVPSSGLRTEILDWARLIVVVVVVVMVGFWATGQ